MVKEYQVVTRRDAPEDLLADIMALENRAHRMGLTLTAHTLNRAKNVLGWTMAGDDARAAAAMNGA